MRLSDKIDIFEIERISDGRGGYKKLEKYKYSIDCNVKKTRLDKQTQLYGEISTKAISITTFTEIDINKIIIYKNTKYKITNSVESFNKFSYDLIEAKND